MSFFGKVSKFFGIIKVKTIGNQVKVSGVDGLIMRRSISRIWQTDTINKMMFTSITDTGFSFNQFFVPDIIYIFAQMSADKKNGWASKKTIDKILHGLMTETWYKISMGEVTSMVDPKRMKALKWQPMPKQLEFLHMYGDRMPRYDLRGYILAMAPGGGKSSRLDSLIRTPSGWKRMGDIQMNETLVMPDGTTAPVCGIYPQGKIDIYRVRFEDGRWTDCSLDHLWKVYNKHWTKTGRPWRVISLKEIMELMKFPSLIDRLYVPLVEPEIKDDVDLPLDPYVLGVLLGDGSVTQRATSICKPDDWLRKEVGRNLPKGYIVSSYYSDGKSFGIVRDGVESVPMFSDKVKEIGIWGKVHHQKTIPESYMNGSAQQKFSLIQGLMDTDGTVSENGSSSFSTTSEILAYQVQELVRSLGGLCKLVPKTKWFSYLGEKKQGRLAYQLNIRIKDPKRLFRLPRKRDLIPDNYQYNDVLKLRIKAIEFVGQHEAQCISVDHPDHLYITDDFIVTHNTFTDLLVASCVIPPSIAEVKIVISPKKAVHLVWEKSVKTLFKKPPTSWCSDSGTKMPLRDCEYYIFNFEALDKAIELGKALSARNTRFFVIVDETHNFADSRSNRTNKLVTLQTLRDDTYFIWTSGSPILKTAVELVSFLKCADPRFDEDAERRFKRIYAANQGKAGEIFNHRLGEMMAFVVPKSEFSPTKPTIRELPVKLPPALANSFLMETVREEMKEFIVQRLKFYEGEMVNLRGVVNHWLEYHKSKLKTTADFRSFDQYIRNIKIISRTPDRLPKEVMAQAREYERIKLIPSLPPIERKKFKNALSAIKNIKLKVRGEALGTILSKRRAQCAAALAYYCQPDVIIKESLSKTLFFASSVLPIDTLFDVLVKKGFTPLKVYGGTNSQLTSIMERFENDPEVNPVCATMQSLSEAVPVIAASTIVLLNRPFRQATWDQVVARADRLGQKHPVTVIETTLDTGGKPNVSSTTDAILSQVRELINELVGPEFAGPDPDEREYQLTIDASEADPYLALVDETMGF